MADIPPYQRYVFDVEGRRFIGAFEEMYRAELREGFDSWHQDDVGHLSKQVSLALIEGRRFSRILDVGCGKGAFTRLLKTPDNDVLGIDVSETAVAVARDRYRNVEFRQVDLAAGPLDETVGSGFDLLVCLETLSYLESWREQIRAFARAARHALVGLYLPAEPIGFVKTPDDLARAFADSFAVIDEVRLETRRQVLLFGSTHRQQP